MLMQGQHLLNSFTVKMALDTPQIQLEWSMKSADELFRNDVPFLLVILRSDIEYPELVFDRSDIIVVHTLLGDVRAYLTLFDNANELFDFESLVADTLYYYNVYAVSTVLGVDGVAPPLREGFARVIHGPINF